MNRFVLLTLFAVAILNGCANSPVTKQAEDQVGNSRDTINQALDTHVPEIRKAGNVVEHDGIWLGKSSTVLYRGEALPAPIMERTYRLATRGEWTIDRAARELEAMLGLPVVLEIEDFTQPLYDIKSANDDESEDEDGSSGEAAAPMPVEIVDGDTGAPILPPEMGMDVEAASGGSSLPAAAFIAEGKAPQVLDIVTAHYDGSWEYRSGRIRIFRYITETFTLATPPAKVVAKGQFGTAMSAGSEEGGSDSGGGSSVAATSLQDTSIEATYEAWAEVIASLEEMIPAGRGMMSDVSSTGVITVKTTPAVMKTVRRFIADQNALLTQQATVRIDVLQVTHNEADRHGLNLNAIFQNASNALGFQFRSDPISNASVELSGLKLSIGDSDTSVGEWSGSEAIINAMSQNRQVSLISSNRLLVMNNRPTPWANIRKETVVDSVSNSVTGDVVTTEINTSVLTEGVSLQVTPRILPDAAIILDIVMTLSSQDGEPEEFTTGGQTIQRPQLLERTIIQPAYMRSGETLLLTGFEQVLAQRDHRGLWDPEAWQLGGGRDDLVSKSSIVILVTPLIHNRGFSNAR